jgi:hypothetical protein
MFLLQFVQMQSQNYVQCPYIHITVVAEEKRNINFNSVRKTQLQ